MGFHHDPRYHRRQEAILGEAETESESAGNKLPRAHNKDTELTLKSTVHQYLKSLEHSPTEMHLPAHLPPLSASSQGERKPTGNKRQCRLQRL